MMDAIVMLLSNVLWATGALSALIIWVWKREEVRNLEDEKRSRKRIEIMKASQREAERAPKF